MFFGSVHSFIVKYLFIFEQFISESEQEKTVILSPFDKFLTEVGHSYRREAVGSARAAFMAWKLTVSSAIDKVSNPAPTNTQRLSDTL